MGVWRSDDAGESWRRVFYDDKFGATHTNTVTIHPDNPQIVLVSDLHGRITKTFNGGGPVECGLREGIAGVDSGYQSIATQYRVLRDAEGNLIKTTDTGDRWTLRSQVAAGGIGSLAVDPGNPDTVYAAARDGVYKSTDGGTVWRRVFPAIGAAADVVEVAVAPADPDLVLAATAQGVFRSTDGGTNWQLSLDHHAHSVQVARPLPRWFTPGPRRVSTGAMTEGLHGLAYSSGIQYLYIGPLTVHPQDQI